MKIKVNDSNKELNIRTKYKWIDNGDYLYLELSKHTTLTADIFEEDGLIEIDVRLEQSLYKGNHEEVLLFATDNIKLGFKRAEKIAKTHLDSSNKIYESGRIIDEQRKESKKLKSLRKIFKKRKWNMSQTKDDFVIEFKNLDMINTTINLKELDDTELAALSLWKKDIESSWKGWMEK